MQQTARFFRKRHLFAHLMLLWFGAIGLAFQAQAGSNDVEELTATFNEEEIQFNDKLITLGSADAKASMVLVYGISQDTSYLFKRVLPRILKKYVESGQLRVTVIEHALTWHDMQAFAGFRCVAADKHWELLQKVAILEERTGTNLRSASYKAAPEHVWQMMKDFGVGREQAEKCMRNIPILGYVEGLRMSTKGEWDVKRVPTLVIGEKVLVNPSSPGLIEDAIELALKGGTP